MPSRIYVAGGFAAGKTTFARQLAARTGLPLHHMDTIIWGPNWVERPAEDQVNEIATVVAGERWILEGWMVAESAVLRADQVVYLDPPGWRLAWQGIKRGVTGLFKKRDEVPEGCHDRVKPSRIWWLLNKGESKSLEEQLQHVPPSRLVRLTSERQKREYLKGF